MLVERKIGARKDLIRAEKELLGARSEIEAVAETIRLNARQDLLAAETALQQARAQRDKLRGKLRLLGMTDAMLADAVKTPGGRSVVPLIAPFAGTVIERQASEGQLVDSSTVVFRLADLRAVWSCLTSRKPTLDPCRSVRSVPSGPVGTPVLPIEAA
jgi:cobalt-zinc-cadmium efflux system membrane fusion protein